MGGYADDLFNVFYRMEPQMMAADGFACGGEGRRNFQQQYGVLETIEKIREEDNACSRASKKTVQVVRKPGASPLLFGKFLMSTTAFLALEDIADNLPTYTESVLSCDMDEGLAEAYEELEKALRDAMAEHRGNKSLMSVLLNTLLLYPDHPYGFEEIWARALDPATKEYYKFLVARPRELARNAVYPKESALIEDIREELRQGRRCQVYATYTGEKDVNARLEQVLSAAGLRVAVLRASVSTQKREEWYDRQLESGVEVVICHDPDATSDVNAWPTPRSWEMASNVLSGFARRQQSGFFAGTTEIEAQLLEGTIGQAATTELVAFLRLFRQLPSIDEILLNPDSAPLPDEPSARIAIATALGRALTDHSIAKGGRYLDRMPTEMRVLAMRDAAARDRAITHTPEFVRFGVEHAEVLQ
jgi:hypothetical protein